MSFLHRTTGRSGRLRSIGAAAALALVATAVISAIASLSPVRFDAKAFGPTLPLADVSRITSRSRLVHASASNDWQSGHRARYGIDLLAPPRTKAAWMVLAEGHTQGVWQPDLVCDAAGVIHALAPGESRPLSENEKKEFLAPALFVVADEALRAALLSRLSEIDGQAIAVMRPPPPMLEGPRWHGDLRSFAGIALLLFALFVVALAISRIVTGGISAAGTAVGVAIFFTLHSGLTYFLGFVTTNGVTVAHLLEICLASLLLALGRQSHSSPVPRSPRYLVAGIVVIAGYYGFTLLRLDFDGDLFTHWIPAARVHHEIGGVDLRLLDEHFGEGHEAGYPPGFPIAISTMLGAAGVPSNEGISFGIAWHHAVLIYRLLLGTLMLSCLLLMREIWRKESNVLSIAIPAVVAFALPLFLGKPTAGEVFFVPIIGLAMASMLAGVALERPHFTRAGLFLAGSLFFVKNEAMLAVPLIVLPWYAWSAHATRRSRAMILRDALVLGAALAPFAVWKILQIRLAINPRFDFKEVSRESFASGLTLLPELAQAGLKILLASNFWIVLGVAIPAVLVARLAARRIALDLIIPAGVLLYTAAMSCVYVFSREDPVRHMEISYERVLMVAVLSSLLYLPALPFMRSEPARANDEVIGNA
ncbi:MAG TPA: hypothetical protein VMT00_13650 [Thermoanaerobaculia bacterium]|nr:hypothetical protein [Thermoanaerobaculia bacterium]